MKAVISPVQFAVLVTAAYIASGVFEFPRQLVAGVGPDALYAYVLECVTAWLGLWLWLRVNRLCPSLAVAAFAGRLVTAPVGYALWLFTLVLHTLLAVVVLTNFAAVMHAFFLDETPRVAVDLALVGTAVYVAWFGLAPLARTLQVIYIAAVALSVLMAALLISKMNSTYALVPSTDLHLGAIALAAYRGSYIFWGYEITVTLFPFVRPEQRVRGERYALGAMAGTFLFFGLGYIFTLGVSGPYLLAHSVWPGVSTLRLIDVASFLIDRLGLFLVTLWALFVVAFLTLRLWCLGQDVLAVVPAPGPKPYRFLLLGFAAVVVVASTRIPNVVQLEALMQGQVVPAMVVFNYAVPLLLLLAARLRPGALRHLDSQRA